jgi:hypothetical protein
MPNVRYFQLFVFCQFFEDTVSPMVKFCRSVRARGKELSNLNQKIHQRIRQLEGTTQGLFGMKNFPRLVRLRFIG